MNDVAAALLLKSVQYVLDRVQRDPDLAYVMHDTEAYARLIEAEANALEEDAEVVRERRLVDLQPPYRRRQPVVVELREQLRELENQPRNNPCANCGHEEGP